MTLHGLMPYNTHLLCGAAARLGAFWPRRYIRKELFMQELNPIHNTLKDLAERADVLRGYL